jgi:Ulp1 family protease
LQIWPRDFACLAPGVWLNDCLIDFFLDHLYNEVLSSEARERSHIFSALFYTTLPIR